MENTIILINGSIRRRIGGRWEARYLLNGVRKSVYASTKRELHRKIQSFTISNETSVESESIESNQSVGITVGEWMTEWLAGTIGITKSTRQRYEIDVRLHIIPHIGKILLDELSAQQLQDLYGLLLSRGLSSKSVKNVHGVIHKALNKAISQRMVSVNVSEGCELPFVLKKEMMTLTDERLGMFLREARDDDFYSAFYICVFTGLRESELLGLTWDCIDFKHSVIRVYRQFRRTNYHGEESVWGFSPLKNKKERTFVAPIQVMNMLRDVQIKQKENQDYYGTEWKNDHNFVLTKIDGSFIQTSQLYRHFKRIVDRIGFPDVRFHDLRHTYATIAIQSGIDLKTISTNLGHATVAFTMDQYAHVSNAMQQQSADCLGKIIDGIAL